MTATPIVFAMPQVVTLTLGGDTGATLMNYPVNRTDFKLIKGVTNEIMFFVKDVDRHPVTLPMMANNGVTAVRIVITDETTDKVLLGSQTVPADLSDKSVLVPAPGIDVAKGVWMLKLTNLDIVDWPPGMLRYSILMDRANDQVMLYSDRGYGPYSQLAVLDGPFPLPREATTITRGDMLPLDFSLFSGSYVGAAQLANLSGVHNAVFHMTGFRGTLTLQASLENSPSSNDSDWFPAQVVGLSSNAGVIGNTLDTQGTVSFNLPTDGPVNITARGNYMWMRFIVHEEFDAQNTFTSLDFRAD